MKIGKVVGDFHNGYSGWQTGKKQSELDDKVKEYMSPCLIYASI